MSPLSRFDSHLKAHLTLQDYFWSLNNQHEPPQTTVETLVEENYEQHENNRHRGGWEIMSTTNTALTFTSLYMEALKYFTANICQGKITPAPLVITANKPDREQRWLFTLHSFTSKRKLTTRWSEEKCSEWSEIIQLVLSSGSLVLRVFQRCQHQKVKENTRPPQHTHKNPDIWH